MSKVSVFVWHDLSGQILAVGRPMGKAKCVPMSSDDTSVVEAELEESSLAALHETHLVDVSCKTVIQHAGATKSA